MGPLLPSAVPVGRLAPSPTGYLHLGNAFAFLLAWLSIRSRGGRLVLRMEDIDPDRSRPEFAEAVLKDLAWLGLDWDQGPKPGRALSGPFVQSRRMGLYEAAIKKLEAGRLVYPCYCTRKELRTLASAPHVGDEGAPYPGICRGLTPEERAARQAEGRRPSLRLRTDCPEAQDLSFTDRVLGFQDWTGLTRDNDFAVLRSDGVIAYQLAVVVDDAAMGVTEVVRGEDLAVSTPRQTLLYRLLGANPPVYGHVPLLLDAAGERLAKRHKSLEISALRDSGIRPEAVVGFLAGLCRLRPDQTLARPGELTPGFDLAALAEKWKGLKLQLPEDAAAAVRALQE